LFDLSRRFWRAEQIACISEQRTRAKQFRLLGAVDASAVVVMRPALRITGSPASLGDGSAAIDSIFKQQSTISIAALATGSKKRASPKRGSGCRGYLLGGFWPEF
jgi:hypothetical protein